MLNRISVNPEICEGKPTIRNLRITVDFILKLIGDGYSADEMIKNYPELEKEDIYEAAKYGAWLASEKTMAIA
jgi:uncharacterized protein (DUF433 family)